MRVRLDVHRRQFRAGNNLPLTIENCGYQETFTRPPERVVALGQNTVEILLLLGLQKQVVASAFGRPAFYRSWLSKTRRLKP
nr:hypothetical protein [Klebsiella pneumoniae subsp. pneumoniae]